jgi:hypothetical protein
LKELIATPVLDDAMNSPFASILSLVLICLLRISSSGARLQRAKQLIVLYV